jgi:hypothetical protein
VAVDVVIAAGGENVRPAVETLAEQLIAFLDATTPDPDLEDSDAAGEDLEGDELDTLETCDLEGDELDTLEACELEIVGESDTDGMGRSTVDDEPSLGASNVTAQQALTPFGAPSQRIRRNH